MQFFNSGIFWFIEGILFCFVVVGLSLWMEDRKTPMNFWKWGLFGVWCILYGFTIAFVGTSLGENEVEAASKGGIIFGLISIILGEALFRLLLHQRKTR